MKKIWMLFSISSTILFFSGCCSIYVDLLNKDEWIEDIYEYHEDHMLIFKLYGGDDIYTYSNDSLNQRFKYEFSISTPNLPLTKLNSFSFTREEGKDTIPLILYYKTTYLKPQIINNLPFSIEENDIKDERGGFRIIAESSESFYKTRKVYISYDIEIGDKRIVRKNIEYKRRLVTDCRPKFR